MPTIKMSSVPCVIIKNGYYFTDHKCDDEWLYSKYIEKACIFTDDYYLNLKYNEVFKTIKDGDTIEIQEYNFSNVVRFRKD